MRARRSYYTLARAPKTLTHKALTLQQALTHVETTAKTGLRLRATIDLSGQDKDVTLRYQWGESIAGLTPEQIDKIAKANEPSCDVNFKQIRT